MKYIEHRTGICTSSENTNGFVRVTVKEQYIRVYFHRSLLGFPLVAPHLLTVLQRLAVTKHGLIVKQMAWPPLSKAPPCLHILPASSAGEVIHLKYKHRLPSPLNWLFSSARSVPQNGSLTGCRNSCAGPEERVTQAQ